MIKNSQKSPHKIFRPSLTKINEQNLFYLVPFEKYWPMKLEQLDHFSYMTILLLIFVIKNHTTNIMWIPIPTTHKPNCGIAPKGGAI